VNNSSKTTADVYIIKGNPDVDTANADKYDAFYNQVAGVVNQAGLTSAFDPGLGGTLPPGGKIWIGHSRGADRLRFAPSGVATIRLDDFEPEESRLRQQRAYDELFKQHGYKNIAEVPLAMRPAPGPEHYTLNEQAKAAITKAVVDKLVEARVRRLVEG
jgi:hypothetical protein